ncbi:hypothetical protein SNE40_021491 [Patella caerulea]|uniref:Extracellular sulfatase n=1 Tax=Patella caerulea TaxID=87958 RepID=A0AAN8G7V6_PATCE
MLLSSTTCFFWTVLSSLLCVAEFRSQYPKNYNNRHYSHHSRSKRSDRPNIIMILTDDQDSLLGSMKVMPKTNKIMRDQGALFTNAFTTTPMCCPSRSSILTGLYTHNHNTYTNNGNCSSVEWQQVHEPRTFGVHLKNHGYTTAYFGKYLNEYNGTYVPPGWTEWVGLIRNSRFYNYSLNFNGQTVRHGDNYYKDYLTDVIANDTVTFLKQSRRYNQSSPVLMVISVPAPHGPEDAAPQYQHMFENNRDHRTPSWNVAPNPDKQWLLNVTDRMLPIHQKFTDLLQRRRLQTLQSVDDLVERVHAELRTLGELDNTYTIYTSDHGYHLGQYGLVKGKAMPYEFDVKIPLLVRGPNIRHKTVIPNIVANVDFAPTILDMAGIKVPEHMDGRSFLPLLRAAKESNNGRKFINLTDTWRDTILLERGKLTKTLLNIYNNVGAGQDISKSPKQIRLSRVCARRDRQQPCKPKQRWYCEKNHEKWYKKRCRYQSDQPRSCPCSSSKKKLKRERKKQREFLHKFATKSFIPKFIRNKRSAINSLEYGTSGLNLKQSIAERDTPLDLFERRCRILTNQTIQCDDELYEDASAWNEHKTEIDGLIKELRKALEDLRVIRRHLKSEKPELEDINNSDTFYTDAMIFQGFGSDADSEEEEEEEELCDCDETTFPFRPNRKFENNRRLNRFNRRQRKHKKKFQKRKRGKECNSASMKCFTHDNDHWKTPPKWTSKPKKRRRRLNHPKCFKEGDKQGMECHFMDSSHWRTAPFWKHGPFCFCPNANNNTYWCLRTVNETHDFLFCEFITRFQSFYDMKKDPYQLKNQIHLLDVGIREQLEEDLETIKSCRGNDDCHMRAGITSLESRQNSFQPSGDGALNRDEED